MSVVCELHTALSGRYDTSLCYDAFVRTTLDLPDDLMRALRIQAAREGRKLKEVAAEALRAGLEHPGGAASGSRPRMRLPLVECAHEAPSGEEVTPERVAEVLVAQDVSFLEERA